MILKSYLISDEGFKGTFAEQAAHYNMSIYSIKNRYLTKNRYINGRSFKKIGTVGNMKVYDVYKGSAVIFSGTMKEISEKFGYKENYLRNAFTTKIFFGFGERYTIKYNGKTKEVLTINEDIEDE